ncbi:MAG: LacI family DNA-binding transcriptional regulator [Novosphingobium sp.]
MSQDPPRKRATLKDVAAAAEVSLASASYAVNGTGTLGEAMRARILKVADELGYRQNLAARTMRTGKSNTLGLLVPDLSNPFFPNLVQAVVQRARQQGYTVVLMDAEETANLECQAIETLENSGVDGIIWFPIGDADTKAAVEPSIPVVVIDRFLPGFERIGADDATAGLQAAEHLLQLGHGYIGIVSGPRHARSMANRCDAAARRVNEAAAVAFQVENGYSMDLEPEVVEALQAGGFTAVIAGGDMIAVGVMRALQELGLHVPNDVSVVGMDDIAWAALTSPPLTTVEIPIEDMAVEAVDAVVRRLESGIDIRRQVILNVSLVVRSSTAAPQLPDRGTALT